MRQMTFLLWVFLLPACVITSANQRVIDNREETVPAQGLREVHFDVRAGDLEVVGGEGASDVRLEAEFKGRCYNDEDALKLLDGMEFSHSVDNGMLTVVTRIVSDSLGRSGSINVRASIPASLKVSIDDTSGDIEVHDIDGELAIDDRSGDIRLSSLGNRARIDDSSGDIEATDVEGTVLIKDSSGDIRLSGVGDTEISDSSGDIDIVNVHGSVVVEDSSGDIEVRDVVGDFEVSRDRSGDIRYKGVTGQVRIPEKKRNR